MLRGPVSWASAAAGVSVDPGASAQGRPPLAGLKVVEFRGIGPGPFGAMLLAMLGADVTVIEPPPERRTGSRALLRGRRSICVDLKTPDGREVATRLIARSDVLIEGFRPGVMERLGLGPGPCGQLNARLLYARVTGWGQTGTLAQRAGHDIDYLAVAGVLAGIGRVDAPPTPPRNYLGDYGAGGMLLAVTILAGLVERQSSGVGQVLDISITNGAVLFLMGIADAAARGELEPRGTGILDSGAPFYDVYETSDGKYVAVGCLEDKFYAEFVRALGFEVGELPDRTDRSTWPALRQIFADAIVGRSREEWTEMFAGVDACVAPVLEYSEAAAFSHAEGLGLFSGTGRATIPTGGPRFSRSRTVDGTAPGQGQQSEDILAELGYEDHEIDDLLSSGAVTAPVAP